MKHKKKALIISQAALIAAMYVVLTYLAHLFGLDRYAIQVRFSEALTVLPFFTPVAIPGLYVGCFLANLLTGAVIWDVVFGSIATLLGALGTYGLSRLAGWRKAAPGQTRPARYKVLRWLAPLPPILSNTLIVPWILRYAYESPDAMWFMMLTVFIGEVITCGILGMILYFALEKRAMRVFESD